MISAEVCGTDSFLSLKHKEQALYYQLVLATDDDGFISNPLSIARIAGCSKRDIRTLEEKNLVICFPSGTLVIVDWNNVNYLRKDRYKPTAHQEDFNRLGVTTQGRYFIAVPWQPAGNQLETSCQPTANQSSTIPQPQPNVTQPNVTLEREVKRESAVVNQEPEPINHNKRTAAPANLEYLPEGTESLDEAATEALRKSCLAQIESATAKAPPPEVDAETAELKKVFRQSAGQEQNAAPAEQSQPPPG